jgi:uncharacterized protein involved in outer membrane biogenesis
MPIKITRRARNIIVAVAVLFGLILIAIAALPASLFRGTAERALAANFDTAVRIGGLERESVFSFQPVINVSEVHVAQPAWAGKGELLSIRSLRVRVHPLSLLLGKFDAELLSAQGVRAQLVRDANRRENWRRESGSSDGGSAGRDMAGLRIQDAVIQYRDAVQDRQLTLNVTVDPTKGLVATGAGTIGGSPVKLTARGGAMTAGKPWPFDAIIEGPALGVHARGSMAGPLRTDRMQFRINARGSDLKQVDRVIEAGLFGTQPVDLAADVRREDNAWIVQNLVGKIGESDLTGHVTARKVDGRTKLDGEAHFRRLRFDDLASDLGNAKALALERAQGLKLVPNTRINIRKISKTDGRITVRADQIIGGRRPSSLTSISGVLNLDNRLLTVTDLRIGLKKGVITGKVTVDQRDGQPEPRVTMALDMANSSIAALAGDADDIDARVDARVRLTGTGSTIREVVGRSNGSIGAVARSGALPRKIAAMLGFDIGKGLLGAGEGQTALRCAVIALDMRGGRGSLNPFLIDTGLSQTRGTGTISFPSEALAITLSGAPKGNAALRLPGTINASGTIREPQIVVPKETKSFGNILKSVGRAITGKNGPAPADADCAALTNRALGGR